MITYSDGYWFWGESDIKYNYKIIGKYLFFSDNSDKLLKIMFDEIEKYNFPLAKINHKLTGDHKEYVLCLYYKNELRDNELINRNNSKYHVKYRSWKSNNDTYNGVYSRKFINEGGYEI
jgi:hypothetical protein